MSNFVKLDTGMLNSSIWLERDLRSVFVTALLMAEPYHLKEPSPQIAVRSLERTGWIIPAGWYGRVEAAGVGILMRDGIDDRERGLSLLEQLCGPDAESRSGSFEGRRMARIDGGYLVLNYFEYRERDYRRADPRGQADSYVYYAQDGDLIKIGLSKNPWARLKDLKVARPQIAIVVTERGGSDLESLRHDQFKGDCVGGEWFRLNSTLRTHLDALRSATVETTVATTVATVATTKRHRHKQREKAVETTTPAPSESDVTGNNGHRPLSWPDEGAELWGEKVGPITAPRFGRALKPVVLKYGWPETKSALLTYLELNEGKTRKVEWFAGDVVRWVALAKMPCVDPVTRELTEKGRMAYSP